MRKPISQIFILVFLLLAFQTTLFAQKGKPTPPVANNNTTPPVSWKTEMVQLQKSIYANAAKYNDIVAAKDALYALIELDPTGGGTASYKDSLLNLFYGSQQYVSAVLLGRELHDQDPKNKSRLAILALAEQNLGVYVESLDHYKKLYDLSQNPSDLYQAAVLEFQLQRYLECNISLDKILSNPASEKEKIYIAYNQQQGQECPLKAAAFNIKGYSAQSMNKMDDAKMMFNEALKVFPEFELAKNNIKQLENPQPQGQGQTKAPGQK